MTILYLILIALGAILYRMGGSGNYDRLFRTIGVPIVSLIAMWVLGKWNWTLWICLPLMYGAMTTYWKCLNKYFHDTTEDSHWYNWAAHGLMIGLAFLPYAVSPGAIGRAVAMAILMTIWSESMDNAVWEECGRGAIIVGTIWML